MSLVLRWWVIGMLMIVVTSFAFAQSANNESDGVKADNNELAQVQSDIPPPSAGEIDQNAEYLEELRAEKQEILKMLTDINTTNRFISSSLLEIAGKYWETIAFSIGVIFTIISILAAYIISTIYKGLMEKIDKKLEDSAFDLSLRVAHESSARTLGQYSFVMWEQVSEYYFQFLQGRLQKTESQFFHLQLNVKMMSGMSQHSLGHIQKLRFDYGDHLIRNRKLSVHIEQVEAITLNLVVYFRTAELLVEGKTFSSLDVDKADELIKNALKLRRMFRQKITKKRRHNVLETASFALLKFGNEGQRERAKTELLELFEAKDKKPQKEWISWRRDAFDRYFPITSENGDRVDIHRLGRIPDIPDKT